MADLQDSGKILFKDLLGSGCVESGVPIFAQDSDVLSFLNPGFFDDSYVMEVKDLRKIGPKS